VFNAETECGSAACMLGTMAEYVSLSDFFDSMLICELVNIFILLYNIMGKMN
jgi:hypothetical protein